MLLILLSIKSSLERITCRINEKKSSLHRGYYTYVNFLKEGKWRWRMWKAQDLRKRPKIKYNCLKSGEQDHMVFPKEWHRSMEQTRGTKNSTHTLIFDKGVKVQWERTVISTNGLSTAGHPFWKKINSTLILNYLTRNGLTRNWSYS